MKMNDEIVYSKHMSFRDENHLVKICGELCAGEVYPLGKIILYLLSEIGRSSESTEMEGLNKWREKEYEKNNKKIAAEALKNILHKENKKRLKVFNFYFNQLEVLEQLILCKYVIHQWINEMPYEGISLFSNLWDFIPEKHSYWNKEVNKYANLLVSKRSSLFVIPIVNWNYVLYGIPAIKKSLIRKDIEKIMSDILSDEKIGLVKGVENWSDIYYFIRPIYDNQDTIYGELMSSGVWEEILNTLKRGQSIADMGLKIHAGLFTNIENTNNFLRKIKKEIESAEEYQGMENYVQFLGEGIEGFENYNFIKIAEDILKIEIRDVLRETDDGIIINVEKLFINDLLLEMKRYSKNKNIALTFGMKIKNEENEKALGVIKNDLWNWKKKQAQGKKIECSNGVIAIEKALMKEIIDGELQEIKVNLEKRVGEILNNIGLLSLLDILVKEKNLTYQTKLLSDGEISYMSIDMSLKEDDRIIVKEIINKILMYQWGDEKSQNIEELETVIDEKLMKNMVPVIKEENFSLLKF